MRKIATLCLMALLLLSGKAMAHHPLFRLETKMFPSVCELRNFTEDKSIGFAAACFVIKHDRKPYIITAAHSIVNFPSMNNIKIRFFNELKEYDVNVLGFDEMSDVAILNLKDHKKLNTIKPLKWGNSDKISIGDAVWLIGHPYTREWSVSRGIVSQTKRKYQNVWQDLIQTDVSLNQGNSGGPLFDHNGRVIGMASMTMGQHGSVGVNFAVSSNNMTKVINDLLYYGHVRRLLLKFDFHINNEKGAIEVIKLNDESSNLKVGDLLVNINGYKIISVDDMIKSIRDMEPDDIVKINVIRDDKHVTTSAKVHIYEKSDFSP